VNRSRRAALLGLGSALAGLGLGGWWLRRAGSAPPPLPLRAGLAVRDVLGGDPAGFARADRPRAFRFPEDHGPHAEYRSEWWYFTGNLRTRSGRPFGFQLTLFRFALAPAPAERPSAWATGQVYMGHLALTDPEAERFHAFERFSRQALGLAGARSDPPRAWLEDWVVDQRADAGFRVSAFSGDVGVDLALSPVKPVVLQGEAGLSQKSAEPGNASYYYSLTRMEARGTVRAAGPALAVDGLAWMDREWGTSALAPGQVGWDWFALQLDDGYDLMYYQLRRDDGTPDPFSKGTLVDPAGTARVLRVGELALEVLGDWRSPRDGVRYPARWRLRVLLADLQLEVRPLLPDQELHLAVRYWEGAVQVSGTRAGRPVGGRGYVELTGYAGAGGRPSGQGAAGG
jgi:predicted secreted hydrolase